MIGFNGKRQTKASSLLQVCLFLGSQLLVALVVVLIAVGLSEMSKSQLRREFHSSAGDTKHESELKEVLEAAGLEKRILNVESALGDRMDAYDDRLIQIESELLRREIAE